MLLIIGNSRCEWQGKDIHTGVGTPAPRRRSRHDRGRRAGTLKLRKQTQHRVLAGPLGGRIAEAGNTDASRQSTLDRCLHEIRREERERDRHIDLPDAAFVARSDLIDISDGAGNDLIKPLPAACD
jgi:hypothetical protein